MPALLRWRRLTEEEDREIARLARAQTAPVRLARRARIVALAQEGRRLPAVAAELGVSVATVRQWVGRFNARGRAGLADAPRSGRPPTYAPAAVGDLVAASLTDPQDWGLPFGAWTVDRLTAYMNAARGVPIRRSRVSEILRAEGLRWRPQESWFGARPDPAVAEKRGPS